MPLSAAVVDNIGDRDNAHYYPAADTTGIRIRIHNHHTAADEGLFVVVVVVVGGEEKEEEGYDGPFFFLVLPSGTYPFTLSTQPSRGAVVFPPLRSSLLRPVPAWTVRAFVDSVVAVAGVVADAVAVSDVAAVVAATGTKDFDHPDFPNAVLPDSVINGLVSSAPNKLVLSPNSSLRAAFFDLFRFFLSIFLRSLSLDLFGSITSIAGKL
ncbi:hypothetical protein BC939DRAFT_482004 [Gamsiella multidivaricata]|uniref:uncharacterized protein n=1 Tax=Gamsiella multidivaricata TaxID=101098 RepID=UPI00221F5DC0|nr:uncharacterized protein BC939DRAFT_482004 [Gamsiella multidivaricata]KAI7816447.1 hypothetical protein BC939DRAFT_482004 [Gamsiella multidivaricata]